MKRSSASVRLLTLSAVLAVSVMPAYGQVSKEPIVGVLEAAGSGWSQLEFVNVHEFPVDEKPRFGTDSKTIFRGPEVGALIYTVFVPPWDTEMRHASPHYHLWNEWGFTLQGDSVLYEAVSPHQKNGMMHWKPQGGWLDRPPYSIHSVNWSNGGGLRSQNPYYLLLYEEGDGSLITIGPDGDHYGVERGVRPEPYDPNWEDVEQWNPPWLVDSAHDLEWEEDANVEGRFVKWLSNDRKGGFRAQLIKIPPGWRPQNPEKSYYQHANVMRYVIYGDMKVWTFDSPRDAGEAVDVREDYFIYQPPRSIWGYGDGPVSEGGAFWLEVTYARGLSHGGGPIEEPKTAR